MRYLHQITEVLIQKLYVMTTIGGTFLWGSLLAPLSCFSVNFAHGHHSYLLGIPLQPSNISCVEVVYEKLKSNYKHDF